MVRKKYASKSGIALKEIPITMAMFNTEYKDSYYNLIKEELSKVV